MLHTSQVAFKLLTESDHVCAGSFVDALRYWQEHSDSLPVLSDPAAASDEAAGPLPSTLSLRYVDAAMAITPSSANSIKPDLLAQILLAVHHPIISDVRRDPGAGWKFVKRKIPNVSEIIEGECCWQIR